MSKALRSMTDYEREVAIKRRLEEKRGGLGYWSAVDAKEKKKKNVKANS